MKRISITLVAAVLTLLVASCNPVPIVETNDSEHNPVSDCCGEQGQLPSEPGDDDDDD